MRYLFSVWSCLLCLFALGNNVFTSSEGLLVRNKRQIQFGGDSVDVNEETRAEGNSCTTPRFGRRAGQPGTCSFISDPSCSQIVRQIQRRGVTRRILNYLRAAIASPCGFDQTDYTLCCPGRQTEPTTAPPTTTTTTTTTTTSRPGQFRSCGSSPFRVRIVGGSEATPGSWPWAVILGQPSGTSFRVFCGGTLIDSTHVLTAAHCFPRSQITHVRLGEHDITTSSDGASPVDIRIRSTKVHEQWNSNSLKNDIAIVTLSQPVSFTSRILPACLPNRLQGTDLSVLPQPFIIGWGSNGTSSGTATALRQAPINVVSQPDCDRAYGNIQRVTIGNDQVCAGNGQIDTCTGDSGGPIQSEIDGRWTILGITSFGVGCAREEFPGVYTRVDNFLSWISTNT
ncbi:hypothetical protein TCAL_01130 [Tigriopus californicus]|uniref:Peptidase S1 domain-containing protein n=1 Tax=Tigriopus californicus TaxID=6832 RepID=A0A553P4U3_TIGCA|nr:chymotrypsin-like elastase family member 2A isoform X2 [Tigriopus californicus]TRY72711.1 hypothetical protein TCAL_01130 [Tigriopus californicus]